MLRSHMVTIRGRRPSSSSSPNPVSRTTVSQRHTDPLASSSAVGNSWRRSLPNASSPMRTFSISYPPPNSDHATITAQLMWLCASRIMPRQRLSVAWSPPSSFSTSKGSSTTSIYSTLSTYFETWASHPLCATGSLPFSLIDRSSCPSTELSQIPSTLITVPHRAPPSLLSYRLSIHHHY